MHVCRTWKSALILLAVMSSTLALPIVIECTAQAFLPPILPPDRSGVHLFSLYTAADSFFKHCQHCPNFEQADDDYPEEHMLDNSEHAGHSKQERKEQETSPIDTRKKTQKVMLNSLCD